VEGKAAENKIHRWRLEAVIHVKDEIARRYLEVFREEIAAGKTNANTPWLDLDAKAYRAYGRGERETLPGPTYTDGPMIRLMMRDVRGKNALCYLAGIGQQYGEDYRDSFPGFSGRRLDIKTGMTVLREYDHVLSAAILDELETLQGVQFHGITDRSRLEERVPTVSFTWGDRHPRTLRQPWASRASLWDGNY
jgi:hypothetical protein